jgi:predicted phosphodiesterase
MKIGIVSDLHAEFWNPFQDDHIVIKRVRTALADADLLLLAGDLNVGLNAVATARQLIEQRPACVVAGNHEFYHHSYDVILPELITQLPEFLDCRVVETVIGGVAVRVIGCTLWTDFNLFGQSALALLDAQNSLNDFRLISYGDRTFKPADSLVIHQLEWAWLLGQVEQPFEGKTIVLTHHAPVSFAISPQYVNDRLSPCFASRLEDHLLGKGVDLVVWGHTHHSVDRVIEDTRFVSNQTGYYQSGKSETGDYGTVVEI